MIGRRSKSASRRRSCVFYGRVMTEPRLAAAWGAEAVRFDDQPDHGLRPAGSGVRAAVVW
jgi:hypothetical protein